MDALHLLEQLPIELYPVDQPLVRAAAEIKSEHALSYSDAFCVATAQRLDAAVRTNDPEFESVESLIKIRWLTLRRKIVNSHFRSERWLRIESKILKSKNPKLVGNEEFFPVA